MDPDTILLEAEETIDKSIEYLKSELRGIRTGRATTALVEYVKVDYYGSQSDLKTLAAISIPEASQILIQPFDPSSANEIKKAIEAANLGLSPVVDGKIVRVSVPSLSGDRRKQLASQAKKIGEDTKVAARNSRRDANKHADQIAKGTEANLSEDEIKTLKEEIQDLLKKKEAVIDGLIEKKAKEITEV